MKYSLSPREIPRANSEGFSKSSCYISPYIPNGVIMQTLSILAVCQIPIWANNTEELRFNIIIFSNWKYTMHFTNVEHVGQAVLEWSTLAQCALAWNRLVSVTPTLSGLWEQSPPYSSLAWHLTELMMETPPTWRCDAVSITTTHYDLWRDLSQGFLWDILYLNTEHLLNKATTKNSKVGKEKDIANTFS